MIDKEERELGELSHHDAGGVCPLWKGRGKQKEDSVAGVSDHPGQVKGSFKAKSASSGGSCIGLSFLSVL